jgi:hypothetical protein
LWGGVWDSMGAGSRVTSVGQEIFLYAVSAAISCLILVVGFKYLDPNFAQSKKAAERKKEIAKRLGRPLVQTNTYEVLMLALLRCFAPKAPTGFLRLRRS